MTKTMEPVWGSGRKMIDENKINWIQIDRTTNFYYRCKYFKIEELVNPIMMKRHTEERLWSMFDIGMLRVIDRIKELCCDYAGKNVPVIINDWLWGGGYKNSGMRVNWGSNGSAHRFGVAFDLKVKGISVKELHQIIRDNQEELYELGLRRVEHISATTPPGKREWCHLDGKYDINSPEGVIDFFRP